MNGANNSVANCIIPTNQQSRGQNKKRASSSGPGGSFISTVKPLLHEALKLC